MEASRFAAVQQDHKHAARIQLPLEPLRDVGGAEDANAQGAEGLGRFLDTGIDVFFVRQVAMGALMSIVFRSFGAEAPWGCFGLRSFRQLIIHAQAAQKQAAQYVSHRAKINEMDTKNTHVAFSTIIFPFPAIYANPPRDRLAVSPRSSSVAGT